MSWREHAACAGRTDIEWVPTSLSMPLRSGNLRAAREVCASCPVRGLCLDEALRDGLVGIWGGTTYRQRERLRRSYDSPERRRGFLLQRLEREAR